MCDRGGDHQLLRLTLSNNSVTSAQHLPAILESVHAAHARSKKKCYGAGSGCAEIRLDHNPVCVLVADPGNPVATTLRSLGQTNQTTSSSGTFFSCAV